ncbi:MAG: hypothetical protein QM765_09810 [Myxococcales bacterium]
MSPTPAPNPSPLANRPQPKIAPKAPETRQEAAKEAFLDVVLNAKSMGLDLIDDFRASDRFLKYKLAVIVGGSSSPSSRSTSATRASTASPPTTSTPASSSTRCRRSTSS